MPSQTTPSSPTSLLIRRMRDEDVPQVMDIESVSFGSHHWQPEAFHNELKNHLARYYALLSTDENKLVGYCGYWVVLDEIHITTVAVHPSYRGRALGELLLLQILEKVSTQSVKWVTLEVRVGNTAAQNLYYKYGFQSMGLRKKYYQDNNEDALIMTTPSLQSPEYRAHVQQQKAAFATRFGSFPQGFES